MAVEVLKSRVELKKARYELRRRGLSFTSSWWRRLARSAGVSKTINVGDNLKSWDVLKTVDFLETSISKSSRILDIGAFASEIPYILHNLRYSNLVGIDLNPNIKKMLYADVVRYEVTDFLRTPFENQSFDVVTAISVIEHGFNSRLLLTELSRLLRPRGYFVASFDYWPDKVDTSGVSFFGMDWKIFSEQEVRGFLDDAREHNLTPRGEVNLSGWDRPIKCAQKEYTFAWLVLQKNAIDHVGGK
jgi:SAM-dependent methyltransferase